MAEVDDLESSVSSWRLSRDSFPADIEDDIAGRGLHVIVKKDSLANELVDIVAVHGLNGHYLKTWTHEESHFNWLRDAIPESIPLARVLSFSYNSSLQFSKSTSDLFTFAEQLLEGLLAQRQTEAEQNRRIIFVCHSLGGIVVKQVRQVQGICEENMLTLLSMMYQAIIRASESDTERYRFLAKRVAGIMFLGTPHRGSGLANWATTFGTLLRAVSGGRSTNTQLSKDLEKNSRVLELISESFLQRIKGCKICSCYETDKMKFMNCVVRQP
jgi:hypothetical protein